MKLDEVNMLRLPGKPTVVVMDPLRLKDEVADPAFQALLDGGFTIATVVVLVDGPEHEPDKVVHRLAFVMAPPRPAAPVAAVLTTLPGRVVAWGVAVVLLQVALLATGIWLAAGV